MQLKRVISGINRSKKACVLETTRTKKNIFVSLIAPYGLAQNSHSLGLIHHSMDMDILFDQLASF